MATIKIKKDQTGSALSNALVQESNKDDQALIKLARKLYTTTSTNWAEIRKESVLDQEFYSGNQMDATASRAKAARGGAPQIQVNQLPNFVRQVENNIRQQNIGIAVHATDETGSEETAKILQGIVRHIEHISNAKTAYIWAAGSHGALVPGFGFLKIETDYIVKGSTPTFDQEIYIRGVKDPMKILPDFNAQLPDFSDAEFWFEFEELPKAEYKEKYTNSKLSTPIYGDWTNMAKNIGSYWMAPDHITVAKYWYKDTTIRHWALFSDGTEGYLDDFGVEINDQGEREVVDQELFAKFPTEPVDEDMTGEFKQKQADAHAETGAMPDEYPIAEKMIPSEKLADVVKMREVVDHTVCWIVTNGFEILDRGEWHDCEFPFVGVVGVDEVINGERKMHGIIHYAKDAQKMVNYLNSQVIRKVDASNKSAWIAADESISEPQRAHWDASNIENRAVLYYKAFDSEGKPIPPPQRGDAIEPAIQGLMQAAQAQVNNIKTTVGIFEAGIGQAMGDRQSGAAILTLAQQGETSNFHFSDNLVCSIKRLGCLIIRLIPKIYDTPRVVRIVGLDDQGELVKINQMFTENGENKHYDIKGAGDYDVVVDTGPTFASKKEQTVEQMLKFMAGNPALGPVMADLVAANMDWDVTNAVQDRIQAWMATQPGLAPLIQQKGQPKMSPQAQAMIQNLTKQLQAAQAAGQHVQGLYAAEKMKNDTNLISHQARERQLQLKGIIDLTLKRQDLLAEQARAHDKLALERVKVELDHVQHRLDHTLAAWSAEQDVNQTTADTLAASTPPSALPAILSQATGTGGAAPAPAGGGEASQPTNNGPTSPFGVQGNPNNGLP